MMRLFLATAAVSLAAAASTSAVAAGSPLLVIHHKVADYAKWRPAYDADQPARTAAGLTGCQVRPTISDPNDIYIACQMADVAKAKAFTAAPRLAAKMKGAGVVGKPEFHFLSAPR
ncbi:MAG TPA: hypothetical protein VGN38_09165 [Caulobacteraceae bacterium]|jgi:hypothetical protein|nr:hypothetical protein [Caulobacteraceae bacterium]